MNIVDCLGTKAQKEKLSHLKNLVALSLADGKLKESELMAIIAVMERENLTQEDLEKCIGDPTSIDFVLPVDDNTRLRYLRDMVILMMSDGDIDEKELVVCKITASALGYRHEIIDAMISDIIADLKRKSTF